MSLKMGVVGTGAIGRDHTRRCAKVLQGVEVVAVSDLAADVPQKLVKDLGIHAKVYTDGVELIHSPEVEAVIVTSSDPTHKLFVLEAVKAGKPVFCEKPLAQTAQECRAIVDAEMKHGKRLIQVGFMRRYDEGYVALKKIIAGHSIGQPLMVHCAHRNQSVGDNYTTDMGITSTLIHELDVYRWLLEDDYASVQVIFPRSTSHTHPKLRDPQLVILETVKGIRIVAEVFVNCQYGYDIQCEIVGELGTAKLPEPQAIYTRVNAQLAKPILVDWIDRFIGSYDIELQAYVDGIRNGKITGPSAWDGYAAAVAADACMKAQKSGVVEAIVQPVVPDFYKLNN